MELVIIEDPARLAHARERIAEPPQGHRRQVRHPQRLVRRPEAIRSCSGASRGARCSLVVQPVDAEVSASQRDAALKRVQDETLPRLDALQKRTGALSTAEEACR